MDHESSESKSECIMNRRDPNSSLLHSYVLSGEEFERMQTEGLNPETAPDEELFRRAKDFYECDHHDRMTKVVNKSFALAVQLPPEKTLKAQLVL